MTSRTWKIRGCQAAVVVGLLWFIAWFTDRENRKEGVRYDPRSPSVPWESRSLTHEGFSVLMPKGATRSVLEGNFEGRDVSITAYGGTDAGTVVTVHWMDYPAQALAQYSPQQLLQGPRGAVLGMYDVDLIVDTETTLQGFPIHDLVFHNPTANRTEHFRVVVAKGRQYLLRFDAPTPYYDAEKAKTFIDSFRITDRNEKTRP
jgi:hypothetical protein